MVTEERCLMILEKKRLESFKHWPYSSKQKCNTQKMAEAGFFWTGSKEEPDSAQCFACNKQLDGWDATDDPWEEHKCHSPRCPFVVVEKPEESLTIVQLMKMWKHGLRDLSDKIYENDKKRIIEQSNSFRESLLNQRKKI